MVELDLVLDNLLRDEPTRLALTLLVIAVPLIIAALLTFRKRSPPTVFGDPDKVVSLKLVEKQELSHDTRLFRFGFPSSKQVLGLPIGKHIMLSYVDKDGEEVARPYTPTTSDDEFGYVDFVIKVYFANVHPKFPDGGKMSQYLEGLKVGDAMNCQGPKGMIEYKPGSGTSGELHIRKPPMKANKYDVRSFSKLGMVAGGTGITPMLQLMRAIKKDTTREIEVSLLFANQSEEDILLRKELDEEAAGCPWFKVWYTVDRPTEGWKYSSGFINADMVANHLPAAGPDTQIVICGPPPMVKFACKPAFEKVGITEDMFVVW